MPGVRWNVFRRPQCIFPATTRTLTLPAKSPAISNACRGLPLAIFLGAASAAEVTKHDPHQRIAQSRHSQYPGNPWFRCMGQEQFRKHRCAGIRRPFDRMFTGCRMLQRETETRSFKHPNSGQPGNASSHSRSADLNCTSGADLRKGGAEENCPQSAGDGCLFGRNVWRGVPISTEICAEDWRCCG